MKKLTRVERKMRRRRNFFKFLLLLFLISLGIVLALKTDFFIINNINVIGNSKIERDKLIEASSISKGENIFKINISLGEKNIKKIPYTKDIKIKRKLPKTIQIEIIERKEIAQIKDISSFLLIDEEGYILDIKDSQNENLPIIVGLEIDDKSYRDNVFSKIESEMETQLIYEGIEIEIFSKIETIDMEDIGDVNIKLIDGIRIAFGSLDNVKYKLSLLDEILEYIEVEEIQCSMILMNKGENPIIVTDEGG